MSKLIPSLWLACLCVLLSISTTLSAAETAPRLALAKKYHSDIDVQQYWVSEKLDGVRGYWDGHTLFTRNGNIINAPQWFTSRWPKQALDGELWIGRGQFEKTVGIVRSKQSSDDEWRQLTFMVFDLHNSHQGFNQRLKRLQQLLSSSTNPTIKAVAQRKVANQQSLQRWLNQVVDEGGEGLMLHRASALYTAGRSNDILKLKPHWDAEAKVIAHVPGKGKYLGKMGALWVEMLASDSLHKQQRFKIGTGFSDAERSSPPAIGSTITYRYQGYTDKGIPRFAAYLRLREAQ